MLQTAPQPSSGSNWQAWPTSRKRVFLAHLRQLNKQYRADRLSPETIKAARRKLINFNQYTLPKYVASKAHRLVADHLDQVLHGKILRLMIFAPPQHGKTTLVSIGFPAFWLAKRPDDPVILTSYGASLAHAKSWECRALVESPEFRELFPSISIDRSARAREHWRIRGHTGEMLASGVGGPITGHGGLLGIVDDPFENWKQAQSPVIRESIWQWYRTTFRTRMRENAAIVIVTTRWHEDDLAGRLLQDQSHKWTILRLPALAETQQDRDENNKRLGLSAGLPDPLLREPGEALCPTLFSAATLGDIRDDVGTSAWNAQYISSPRAPEGHRFKRNWFKIVDAVPDGATRVIYWDKAATEGGGAFTAGVMLAHLDGITYVERVFRGQWSAANREKRILEAAEQYAILKWDDDYEHYEIADPGPEIYIEQEPGSGGKESADATIASLKGFRIRRDRPTGSKDARLEPFAVQAENGKVVLVRGPWNWAWLEEICTVPFSTYRDQADASSGAFNKLVKKTRKRRAYHGLA